MQHLQILLLSRLHWDKSHSRALCSLIDRLGINGVVLGAFDKQHYEPRMNEAHGIPQGLELSAPMMSAGAGLNGDGFRGKLLNGGVEF